MIMTVKLNAKIKLQHCISTLFECIKNKIFKSKYKIIFRIIHLKYFSYRLGE